MGERGHGVRISPPETWREESSGVPTQPVIRQMILFSVFFLTESCSELPPVDNSVFVAKEEEGQIMGVYLCIRGYHLVGEQTLALSLSEEWEGPSPECRCEFVFSVHINISYILLYAASCRPC